MPPYLPERSMRRIEASFVLREGYMRRTEASFLLRREEYEAQRGVSWAQRRGKNVKRRLITLEREGGYSAQHASLSPRL